jgi:hypothetical protein
MEPRQSDVTPRWSLDGQVFGSEAEYWRARRKRALRRARIVARLSVEEGELLAMPGVEEEAVRRYYERLELFWSAEDGWHDVGEHLRPADSGVLPARPAR